MIFINSSKSIKILSYHRADFIFVSWPKIVKADILDTPKYFCIGTHPTNLPYNRGRHPLHWIIALGISETKLSFFMILKTNKANIIETKITKRIKNEGLYPITPIKATNIPIKQPTRYILY